MAESILANYGITPTGEPQAPTPKAPEAETSRAGSILAQYGAARETSAAAPRRPRRYETPESK